ncbi:MAG: hypothetical protein ABJA62_08950, partial [Luteimonas sp.]
MTSTDSAERQWAKAQRQIVANRLDEARFSLESLLQHQPAHHDARRLLAAVSISGGHVREGARHLVVASQTLPPDLDAICKTAHALINVGETVAARDCLEFA